MNTEIINERKASLTGEAYEWMQEHLKGYVKLMHYYKCAMMEIETKLNVLNEEYSIELDRNPINNIKSRLKRPESIKDKLDRLACGHSLKAIEENIYDIAGIRVICMLL